VEEPEIAAQEVIMRRIVLGAWVLIGLAACDDPTQPAAPSAGPVAEGAAVEHQFRVRNLGTLGGFSSHALGINEQGEVVGFADIPPTHVAVAFLWRAGQGMRSLGTLGGESSTAFAINDRGEVVGTSDVRPGSPVTRAFLWSEARGMRGLGTLGGRTSQGNGINNRREVVGTSQLPNGDSHAFLWRPGSGMRDLGTLGGENSVALDMNDATQVVGQSETGDGFVEHAFLWTAARGMEDLGTLGGSNSIALSISQTGVVVGESETAAGTVEAFLWTRARGCGVWAPWEATSPPLPALTHTAGVWAPATWSRSAFLGRSCGLRRAACSGCPRSAASSGQPVT